MTNIGRLVLVAGTFLLEVHATATCEGDVYECAQSEDSSLLQRRKTLTPREMSVEACVDGTLPFAWSGGGAHDCSTYMMDQGYCLHQAVKEACCFCGGGSTGSSTTAVSGSCVDGALNEAWNGGGIYTCDTYGPDYCGHDEIAQKCCYCGGGSEDDAPAASPTPPMSTPAPPPPTQSPTLSPTSPPTSASTPMSTVPSTTTGSSTTPGSGSCVDGALNEEWNGGGIHTCDTYGPAYCGHDEIAQKCCYCGGGSEDDAPAASPTPTMSTQAPASPTQSPPTSPPTSAPTPMPTQSPPSAPSPTPALSEGCSACVASGEKCYVSSWSEPCFTPDDSATCTGTYGGEWCGSTVVPGPSPPSSPGPSPPSSGSSNCTGNAEVDAILAGANLEHVTSLSSSSVYSYAGFCDAVRIMSDVGLPLASLGGGDDIETAKALTNIASLLAQCMWESGGDAPFSACDENNYINSPTAPCTQRSDGSLYADLTSPPACDVDLNMHMVAETRASWTSGPMECTPNTVTAGCCWWGRGAIQTTGPHNYRVLQQDVVSKVESLSAVDLCTNPEAMCQRDEMKWLGALYYWTDVVQKTSEFPQSLSNFVTSGFSNTGSEVNGASFNQGTGGVVNNGFWTWAPHENAKRMANFDNIIAALRTAGMGQSLSPTPPVPTPSSGSSGCDTCTAGGENCYVASWAVPCFTAASSSSCAGYGGVYCV